MTKKTKDSASAWLLVRFVALCSKHGGSGPRFIATEFTERSMAAKNARAAKKMQRLVALGFLRLFAAIDLFASGDDFQNSRASGAKWD